MRVRSPRALKPLSSPGEPHALEGGARNYYGGHRTRTCTGLRPAVFKTAALPVRSSPPDCYYGTYAAEPWREARFCAVTVPLAGEKRFPTAEARSASSM